MQITRLNSDTIELSNDDLSLFFTLNDALVVEGSLVLGPKIDEFMSYPGEYEHEGVSIIVVEAAKKLIGIGNMFRIGMDGVSVGFVTDSMEVDSIDKKVQDALGDIDVLFVPAEISKKDAKKLNNDFSPRYILGLNTLDSKTMEEIFESKANFSEKKLKLNKKDVVGDDYITVTGVLLDK